MYRKWLAEALRVGLEAEALGCLDEALVRIDNVIIYVLDCYLVELNITRVDDVVPLLGNSLDAKIHL